MKYQLARRLVGVVMGLGMLLMPLAVSGAANVAGEIGIDPVKEVVNVAPGEQRELTLKIDNGTADDKQVEMTFAEFTVDTGGVPAELENPTADNAAAWFAADTASFTITALGSKTVTITLEVPENAEPKGYYVMAITSLGEVGDSSASNATRQEIQTLYSVVVGEPAESLEIANLVKVDDILMLTVYNPADVHTSVSGKIDVMLGDDVVETYPVDAVNVFPGKERAIMIDAENMLSDNQAVGRVSLAYGRSNAIVTSDFPLNVVAEGDGSQSVTVRNQAQVVSSDETDNNEQLTYLVIVAGVVLIGAGVVLVARKK